MCQGVPRKIVWFKNTRVPDKKGVLRNKKKKLTTWRCMSCQTVFEGFPRPDEQKKQFPKGRGVPSNSNWGSWFEAIGSRQSDNGSAAGFVCQISSTPSTKRWREDQ